MKALVKVGYGCNNHCTFCHTLDVREIDAPSEEVDRKIDRAARLGYTMIVLSGGEVTMRRELLRWAAHSAARDMDFGLVTNGRMLAYPELVDRLMKLRLRYVYMSLHGGTAKVHNSLVRADAFEQTFAAVGNLSGRGLDFTVNTVVTKQNLEHLRGVVDALLPWPDAVVKFSMVQPKGGGERLFEHLIPRVTDVAAKVKDAIEYGLDKGGGKQRYTHDGIPFCLLPGHEDRYDDLKTHRFATMIEVGEPDFFPVDDVAKVQPDDECGRCAVRGPCPGLYAGYREVHGDGEVRAVTGRARSNSFTYVREGAHGRAPNGGGFAECPVRQGGVTPWDRGRVLFLRDGARVERYRTESRDFTDVEIAHTKLKLGQIYLDASVSSVTGQPKDAPDDFAKDLVALRRSATCDPCDQRDHCGGLWEKVTAAGSGAASATEDVFTRDDALVRDVLAQLRGDVLDVGCGEGRYEAILAPRAKAGEVRWVGLEPDAQRAAAMRERAPWATVRVGEAEDVTDEACFDHVLILRSWNHLHDPAKATAALVRALRPGGTLLVVDNLAFGLLRGSRLPLEEAGTRPTLAWEHYRNDDASRAHAVLSHTLPGAHLPRPPLELLERRDVGPASSNQWLLRYRRA